MEHSNIMGGSTAARRLQCPGSYQAEKKAVEIDPDLDKSSEAADMGTACHEAMEDVILDGLKPLDLIGRKYCVGSEFKKGGYEMTDDPDGLLHTKVIPAYQSWCAIEEKYGRLDCLVEVRGDYSRYMPGVYGTSDIIAYCEDDPTHKIILDWKFGDGVQVAAKENKQAGFYFNAAAMTRGDDELIEIMAGAEKVTFIIVQPTRSGEPHHDEWQTDIDWLHKLHDSLVRAYELAIGDKPPLKGGPACKFCRAMATCEVKQTLAVKAKALHPDDMDDAELSYWLNVAEDLNGWIGAIKSKGRQRLLDGGAITSHKIVAGRNSYGFKDPGKNAAAIARKFGVDVWAPPKPKAERVLSLSAIKNLVKADYQNRDQPRGQWKKDFDKFADKFIEVEQGADRMVPIGAPGKAKNVDAAKVSEAFSKMAEK